MQLTRPSGRMLAALALFALSVMGFTVFVWLSFGGSLPLQAKGYRFSVPFGPEAANLTPNAQARIAGVTVGRVKRVERGDGTIDATIELDPAYAPIARDARAIVRYKTLLGETYVELAPGSRHAPALPDGGTLPAAQVAHVQQIDRVLAAFDRPTRRAFKRTMLGLSASLRHRSVDVNAALAGASPALDDLARLTAILDSQEADVRGLVRDSGRALRALGRREADLRDVVTAGDAVFAATASRDRELTATVRALPGFLGDLRSTLAEVDAAALDAAPTLRALRPVAPLARPALTSAARLAPELERLFSELRPAVPELRRALAPTTRVLDAARPLMRALDPAGRELVPVVELLNAYRRELVALLANLAAAAEPAASEPGPDGGRLRYARALPLITTEQLFGFTQRLPSSRYNPYPRPGALDELGRPAHRSLGCSHLANPQTVPALGGAPPCLEQAPWRFGGRLRSYPHLERLEP
jgi:virulence factor Mce-like protein